MKQEIPHLKQVFYEKNNYSKSVINQVVEQVEAKHQTVTHSNSLLMDNFEQTSAINEEKKPFATTSLQRTNKWFLVKVGK